MKSVVPQNSLTISIDSGEILVLGEREESDEFESRFQRKGFTQ